ncbi:unnamed protein product [Allacma fusca]|uniref:Uncharacterized protein n=1 Tax=Allacma fusca TaxID=39272 RepID=A0A8J2PB37_9HEXA|nr:unnamed protein product [Allacma fusca]
MTFEIVVSFFGLAVVYELFLLRQSLSLISLKSVPLLLKGEPLKGIHGTTKVVTEEAFINETFTRRTKAVMASYVFISAFMTATMLMSVWIRPESLILVSSIYGKDASMWVKIAASAFQFGAHGLNVSALAFNVLIICVYVHVIINFLLCARYREYFQGRHISTSEFIHHYRKLSLLQTCFNKVYGTWVLGCEAGLIWVVVINIFIMVVFGTVRSFVNTFITSWMFLQLFKMLGQVHDLSKEILWSWKGAPAQNHTIASTKCIAAFRPLHVSVGSFYFADKSLFLTILSIILTSSANLILTFTYD